MDAAEPDGSVLQSVSFPVAGGQLHGVLHLPDGECVGGAVTLHGTGGSVDSLTDICAALAGRGVAGLRFTLRDGMDPGAGLADAGGAVRLLRAHPSVPERVGIVGHSFGAVVAALAAGRDSRVRAAALVAAPAEWPFHGAWKPLAEMSRTRARVLLVVAGDDQSVDPRDAARWGDVLSQARVTHRVVTVDGADHDFTRPGTRDRMASAVADWLHESLRS